MSYFPTDRGILSSSIWIAGTPLDLKVWLYLLLKADHRTGTLNETPFVIAHGCALVESDVEMALERFQAPDPRSRTKDHGGRRIEIAEDGTITILNYLKYFNKDHSTPRVQKWRAKQKRNTLQRYMKQGNTPETKDKDKDILTDKRTSSGTSGAGDKGWSRQACDDWIDRYGGTAPGGAIGQQLGALVKKHGWPAVRQGWRSYLEQTEAQYAAPSRFANTFGEWAPSVVRAARQGPAAPAVVLPPEDLSAKHFWGRVRVLLAETIPGNSFATWFRPVEARAWTPNGALVLIAPSVAHRDSLAGVYQQRIRAAMRELGKDVPIEVLCSPPPVELHNGGL